MFRKYIFPVLALLACLAGSFRCAAAEVDCDATYCFTPGDFSEEALSGICIVGLPAPETGTVRLGTRVIRSGDILTADQVSRMTFSPLLTQTDQDAVVSYLPIYENRVAPAASMVIAVRGKTDKAPVAEDSALETYKNLSNEGSLKVFDPEGQPLVYTLNRQPKRGDVTLREDGTFLYTPKKNKVGVDSFTFTATDPAGNISREATVTIHILKPADKTQYADTAGSACRFAAEWMKNTGLLVGETVAGQLCFGENKSVSRGELVTMVVKALGIPVEETATATGYADDVPGWLQPYLAAAMRAGLTAGLPVSNSGTFDAEVPATAAEAAVLLQNALDLAAEPLEDSLSLQPVWAADAVFALESNGISCPADVYLTRGQAAQLLYQASLLADTAPGLQMYR